MRRRAEAQRQANGSSAARSALADVPPNAHFAGSSGTGNIACAGDILKRVAQKSGEAAAASLPQRPSACGVHLAPEVDERKPDRAALRRPAPDGVLAPSPDPANVPQDQAGPLLPPTLSTSPGAAGAVDVEAARPPASAQQSSMPARPRSPADVEERRQPSAELAGSSPERASARPPGEAAQHSSSADAARIAVQRQPADADAAVLARTDPPPAGHAPATKRTGWFDDDDDEDDEAAHVAVVQQRAAAEASAPARHDLQAAAHTPVAAHAGRSDDDNGKGASCMAVKQRPTYAEDAALARNDPATPAADVFTPKQTGWLDDDDDDDVCMLQHGRDAVATRAWLTPGAAPRPHSAPGNQHVDGNACAEAPLRSTPPGPCNAQRDTAASMCAQTAAPVKSVPPVGEALACKALLPPDMRSVVVRFRC